MIYGRTLASIYDALNDEINYTDWADFICSALERFSPHSVKKICELACGTGSVATLLSLRGFDVTAIDISSEMLTEADKKSNEAGASVRYVNSDMRHFSLYSRADACICLLDSMNYLLSPVDFCETLTRVRENTVQGGIFIFDINSKYKFEKIYSDNAYVLENEGILCAWQNFYNKRSRLCDFYLSIFSENRDGSYTRCDEHQRERMYTLRAVSGYLERCGFELLGVFSDFDFNAGNENRDERLFVITKTI